MVCHLLSLIPEQQRLWRMENQLTQKQALDAYYQQVQDIILNKQDWITGLLPASTSVTVHGDYTDAWVRDNVYSIIAAWGLSIAYRKNATRPDRAYLLEQSVVKLMRGLLSAMMRQAHKVEKFKHTQHPMDALHAKYDTRTGGCVVGDHEWGHLQLDATSLFLLILAQMTASGLRIVFTIDEVNFVQNLVHYISRSYRIPDYGIWERGDKSNHGIAELNASSLGMAKAALESLSGFNLFGKEGGQASVVHVINDDIARLRIALEAILPRESISKEVDSAVLSIIGFPAFAIDDKTVRNKTELSIRQKLEGRYGYKRFLLDGHQTVLEDRHRHYYDPQELKQFKDIECEWPLFFTYRLINCLFSKDLKTAAEYRSKLENLLVERNSQKLLPELYYIPEELIAAEKTDPHSQSRLPNDNVPLVWAQSVFILGCLIQDGYLDLEDIDPLRRHQKIAPRANYLQVFLLAQNETVKQELCSSGITSQTLAEIAPVEVREANELADAYTHVGRNDCIGLTGRPYRQIRSLATSLLYMLAGKQLVFLPQILNQKGFYLALDNHLLTERLRVESAYIHKHWVRDGNPLIVINIKQNMLDKPNRRVLIDFIKELQKGRVQNIPVKLGFLNEFLENTGYEKIDYLHDFKFSTASWIEPGRPYAEVLPGIDFSAYPLEDDQLAEYANHSDELLCGLLRTELNLYVQIEILTLLHDRNGLNYQTGVLGLDGDAASIQDLLEEVYERAGNWHLWPIVRRCAALLGKYDINLEQAATEILVRQHALSVGMMYSRKSTFYKPADSSELLLVIRAFNHNLDEQIIIQELILYLGILIKAQPELFQNIQTIRVGHLLKLIIAKLVREQNGLGMAYSDQQAFRKILTFSPYELSQKVFDIVSHYGSAENQPPIQDEMLIAKDNAWGMIRAKFLDTIRPNPDSYENWYQWRELKGSIGRENDDFFANVWVIVQRCRGLIIGDRHNSKRRIDCETILAQMTEGEQSFKLCINHALNKIQAAVHRQLTVEVLSLIATVFRDSPTLRYEDTLSIDLIIEQAVKMAWLKTDSQSQFDSEKEKAQAWRLFYGLSPTKAASYSHDALLKIMTPEPTQLEQA